MIPPEQIREQLERILASPVFAQAERASRFLRFAVTLSLEGRTSEIKESVIAVEALQRTTSFDPRSDPIVRVEAGRLRNRLKDYYEADGANDRVVITVPKGSYVPEFAERTEPVRPMAESAPKLAWTRRPTLLIAAGALIGLLLSAIAFSSFRRSPAEVGVMHLSVLPPPGAPIQSSRISPNGRMIVFTAVQRNNTMLWVRSLDSPEARILSGTEGASQAFWSPDSRSIAFLGTRSLKRVEVAGGPATEICPARIPLGGGSWSRNDVIVFSPKPEGVLMKVAASGGTPEPATSLDAVTDEIFHSSPEFLPDGRHFLYVATSRKRDLSSLRIGSLDGKESRLLLQGAGNAAYAPPIQENPGSLLFYFRGALMAQPFDAERMTLNGGRTVVASEVFFRGLRADFSVSSTNLLAYRPDSRKNLQMGWFDRTGKLLQSVGPPNDFFALRLSPDDKRLTFADEDDFGQGAPIWCMEWAHGQLSRASDPQQSAFQPVWSPDGSELLYSTGNEQRMQLVRQSLTNSQRKTIIDTPGPKFVTDWSVDGRFVAYETPWPDFSRLRTVVVDLRKLETSQDSQVALLDNHFSTAEAVFSPDSSNSGPRWIAYSSTETGRREVYVQSLPSANRKWQVSNGGARQPAWRSDGRELFFLAQDGTLMAVDVGGGPSFDAGLPHALFRTTIPPYPGSPAIPTPAYAVSKDGQRFLVNQAIESGMKGAISIVTNWRAYHP